MRNSSTLLIAAALALGLALPAHALRGPNDVRDMVRTGEIMPFEVIQRRVLQDNEGEYVGAQFDQGTRVYRFRFLRDGNLINVDVDARTGQPVRRRQSY
ncbi:PepSY domain-containing protein [Sandarakinorhabdus rubra]|uniref:PepSY domain-containing protein n=1 Tax=Sandarakinorhabdus rubra TaxID=2672568 RepID=UPI0013DCD075|nr:PepSY domain-containing protein [Sandarakinorhabdus rubra]